jgi:alkanesulfonate monooxygenase SsuD/methylene tetrahydromethanopterin reductase-like flavin-dependent oxidoreductase (luciferase family)
MMGAVAAATHRVAIGSLVARASLRPPATLAHGFDTVARIAGPDRLRIAVGAGDGESQEENETFGLGFGTIDDRTDKLRVTVDELRDRGYPVWVGGTAAKVRALAGEHADGWNRWGPPLERFAVQAAELRAVAVRDPFTLPSPCGARRSGDRGWARHRVRRARALRRGRRHLAGARADRLVGSRQLPDRR